MINSKEQKTHIMNLQNNKEFSARTTDDSSTKADEKQVSPAIAKPNVVRSGGVGMVDNEKHIYELIQQIEKSLQEVISVHGQIKNVSKIGNSIAIFFNDGNIYKQPLASKETRIAVIDNK